VLPFFHVAGIVIGLLSTLAAGGCVVIHPAFDPLAFPQLLRKHKVTWFTAVPAIFKAFLEHKGLFETQVRSFIFAYKISQYISHLFFLSICPFRVVLFRPCALCALVLPL
jgi:acyl-CoA synthetase (AMP-forming)/AMP-acid ligase II